jgi:pimeloyl-ACP methyl ester carboxylesterase
MSANNITTDLYSQEIPVSDAVIHCRIAGREDAPALVFLHGNGEDLQVFNQQIDYFAKYYRTVAMDTRGHGQSTRGKAPFNFYTFANDLTVVLETLQIDRAHIVGFSDGAITALHTALIAPKRIASMVLLGTNYNTQGLLLIPRLQIRFVYTCLSVVSLFSSGMRRRKEVWGLMVNQPNLTVEEITQVTVPTLVVTGENDMVSQRHNDEISRAIAGSRRLIISGSDHFWMFQKPELLTACIKEFLDESGFFTG